MSINILIGLVFLAGGILFLWWSIKNPSTDELDSLTSDIKGYIGGIGAIFIGILLLLGKVHW